MFHRPGTQRPAAFGISFDVDKDDHRPVDTSVQSNQWSTQSRKSLPIYNHRTEILYLVENHPVTILVGETGSGKTTQVPQYLHEAGWTAQGQSIACTQPRRVAAMTVAARVAEEMGTSLGQQVGYAVRFEDVSTPGKTKIKFCTDGVLLREMMADPLLTKYSVVMVDEAHERSLSTDVLLGLLKKVQRRRSDLKIIVASATMQAERVAEFFGESQCALLSVQGRPHSVQVHYLAEPTSDYIRTAVEAAVNIHIEDLPGDVLIFLTGQEECERAASWLREEERKLAGARGSVQKKKRLRLHPVTLYAGLPAAAQLVAFEPAARGTRKVVVATNIAETSVTIEGIVYVIDCMYAKQRCFDPITGLESLLVASISKANAAQRAGRAGRVRPGHAFRLCTQASFVEALQPTQVPEMQRASLASVVLQLKSLGIDNMMTFHWLAPPPAEAMVRALETLHALGAIGDDAKLTNPLGNRMSELPLDPPLSKALLAAADAGCAVEVATIVAMLSVQSVWAHAGDSRLLDAAKARFAVAQGDLISYLNVWQGWEESGRSKKWCYTNFVSHRSMLRVADVRVQLLAYIKRFGLPVVRAQAVSEKILKALTAGLFLNAARLEGEDVYRLIRNKSTHIKLRIHPQSVLFRCRPQWVCFVNAQQNESGWYEMQELISLPTSDWLTEIAGHYFTITSSS